MPRDILIDPQRTGSGNPNIQFSGSAGNTILLEVLSEGSVQFTGVSGSLFRISDFPAAGGSLNSLFLSGTVAITGSFIPGESNGFDLGSSTKKWANIYSTNIIGSLTGSNLTAGQVVVAGAGGTISGSSNFWWDNSAGRVGIGTTSPGTRLHVSDNQASATVRFQLANTNAIGGPLRIGYFPDSAGFHITANGNPAHTNNTSNTVTRDSSVRASFEMLNILGSTLAGSYLDFRYALTTTFSPVMRIQGDGNVGIGTTSPATKLAVYGGAVSANYGVFSGSLAAFASSTGALYTYYTGTTAVISANSDNSGNAADLDIFTGATRAMRINTSQNVGIGTVTYTARLFVSGTSTASTPTMIVREGVVSPTGGAGVLNVQNSAGTSLLFVSGSGNVGIGTAIPGAKLDIRGAARLEAADPRFDLVGTYRSFMTQVVDGANAAASYWRLYDITASANRIVCDASGNVGIGTNSPSSLLHMGSNLSTANVQLTIDAANAYQSQIIFRSAGTAAWSIYRPSGNTQLRIYDHAASRDAVILDSATSNIGIGTGFTAGVPSARLHVSGSNTASTATMIVREGVASPTGGVGVLNVQNSAGTSLLFVSGSGNVGIGTSSPNAIISVYHASLPALSLWNSSNYSRFATNVNDFYLDVGLGGATGATVFRRGSGTAESARIDSNGNVGIGTSVMADKLAVNGSMSVTGSLLPGTDNTYDLGSAAKRWATVFATSVSGSLTGSNVLAGQVVVAGTGGVLSGTNNLYWNNTNSYLGIGTGSPTQVLHVRGSTGSDVVTLVKNDGAGRAVITLDSGGTSDSNVRFASQGTNKWSILNTPSDLGFYNYTTSGYAVFIAGSTGNVGVNTTTTTAKFTVSGSSTSSTPTMVVKEGVPAPSGGVGTFDVQNSAGTSLLFVSGSGAVGIGTTVSQVPSHKLHVSGKIGGGLYVDSSLEFLATGNTELKANSDLKLGYALSTVIRSTGNVGIGTATPSSRLHVYGSSTSTTSTAIIQEGTTPTGGAAALDVQNVSGTTLFFVSGSGRVGIASSSPSARLEINLGGSNAEILALKTTYAADNSYHSMTWRDGSNITGQIDTRYDGTNVDMVFGSLYSGGYNSTERMRIKGNGNVGIGTTTVGSRLHVNGSTSAASGDTTMLVRHGIANGANLPVLNVQNSAGTSLLFVSGSGNVGIGTASPSYKLAIENSDATAYSSTAQAAAMASVRNTYGAAGNTQAILTHSTANYSSVWNVGLVETGGGAYTGAYIWQNRTGAATWAERVRIDSSGNVGIGTSTTGDKLAVNGSMSVTGSLLPGTDNLYNLGSATKRWANVVSNAFSGSLTMLSDGTTPYLQAGTNVTITTGSNGAVTIAASLAGGTLSGAGTTNYIPKYTASTTLGNSNIFDNGTNVGIGTTLIDTRLVVNGNSVFSGSVNPDSDITKDLGSSTKRWNNIYAANISGSLTGSNVLAGQVVLAGAGGVLSGSNDFYWNNSNRRVGIGTSSPSYDFQVGSSATVGTRTLALIDSGYGIVIKGGNGNGIVQSLGTTVPLELQAGNGNNGNYYFTSTGNVGIGTATVASKIFVYTTQNDAATTPSFDFHGAFMRIGDYTTNLAFNNGVGIKFHDGGVVHYSIGQLSGNFYMSQTSDDGNKLFTPGRTDVIVFNSSGNVGIGSTSPGYKLDVNGDLNIASTRIFRVNGTAVMNTQASNGSDIYMNARVVRNESSVNTDGLYLGYGNSGTTTGHIRFFANGTTERMKIAADTGSVIISDLAGSVSTSVARLLVSGSSTASTSTMIVREGVVSPTGGAGTFDVQNSAGTSLLFVSGSGNVGIGTISQGARFYVSSSLTGNAASALIIGGQVFGVSLNTFKGHTQLFQLGNGTETMRIDASGNVGIGTGAIDSRLVVNGNSVFSGSANPDSNNTRSLGSSTKRWQTIYAATGSISNVVFSPVSTGNTYTTTFASGEAGRLTATKTINSSTNTTFFTVSANNGASMFDVSFVVSESGFSVARKYSVAAQFGSSASNVVTFKTVDTGPYSGSDLTVSFSKTANTVTTCTVSHNYSPSANIAMTIDISAISSGGSPTTVTIF